jgi:hypothetical protein
MIPPFQIHDLYSVLEFLQIGAPFLVPCATWRASTTRPTVLGMCQTTSILHPSSLQSSQRLCLPGFYRSRRRLQTSHHSDRTTPISYPGREVYFQWDHTDRTVGPNDSHVTSTTVKAPKHCLWISQLNTTYTPLTTYLATLT